MAKSVGFGIVEFSSEFQRLKPDIVLLIGDRYEALAAAIAAAYMNRCLVHIQGGEVSGSIDESARHAISKFAQFHFPSTTRSALYLKRMGERPDTILGTGCPSSDIARAMDRTLEPAVLNSRGSGATIDISKDIRTFRDRNKPTWLRTLTNLSPEKYLKVLANTACAIGNSSSFVRDAGYFGTPVVLVGNRQEGREHDVHVKPTLPVADEIESTIRGHLRHGRYAPSTLYGDGHVSERIADAIVRLTPYVQKRLHFPYELPGEGGV
jgi:UDP-N-acetylglucosamine 2-epimerase